MQVSADISVQAAAASERKNAKMKLYVLLQAMGWGAFFAVQTWASFTLPEPSARHGTLETLCFPVVFVGTGILISHYGRRLIERWKWKQLGWRPLFPRIFGIAVVGGLIWSVCTYSWSHLLAPPPPTKWSPIAVIFLYTFDCSIVLSAWLCLYFFYHLFDRLSRSEIERFQLISNVKEAELRALKSQVNPHFIFNSLNSLRALIEEDPARARKSVTHLANLLRYSLQSGQLETVPLEDELGVVNDYLALEQVRFEERLRLRLDVAPSALRLRIPPMLLQTLVENAVKYGIAARPEGGEISIVARNEGGTLRILVSNPGEIRSSGPVTSTGVGLHNAAERLRLIFGESATLRLLAEQPSRVVAEAVIPLSAVA